jgi:dienelactone hydrolase
MARKASGAEHVEAARELLRTAKTVEQMRQAQAVLLPLELGLSLEQTAQAIGRSVGATCNMRTRFMAVCAGLRAAPRSKRELRNRASATLGREAKILDEVLRGAAEGAVLVVPQLKAKIEARLGKPLALSSVYRMLARHGWRKLAPDTRHPEGDSQAREDWKKNSAARWSKS